MNILKRIDLDNPKKTTESFIYQCLPVLAHVQGRSASEIIGKLKENKEYDVYGDRYSGLDILRLWRFFYETNASAYIPKPATKCTQISSGVPIIMLAYKHQHDIDYERWRGDKYTRLMLPKSLGFLVGDGPENAQNLNFSELATKWPSATLREYSEQFLTDVNSAKIHDMTSYKAYKVGDKDFDQLPALLKRMLLQTWIYHPSVRHENMITDPCDWNSLIDPLYVVDGLGTVDKDPWDDILSDVKPKSNELPW